MKTTIFNLEKEAAYKKAEAIINSCTSCSHLMISKRYIEIYGERFNDDEGFNQLFDILIKKQLLLDCEVTRKWE